MEKITSAELREDARNCAAIADVLDATTDLRLVTVSRCHILWFGKAEGRLVSAQWMDDGVWLHAHGGGLRRVTGKVKTADIPKIVAWVNKAVSRTS